MCMPLAWALEVGGFEEETDPVGGQDAVMGHMLINCFTGSTSTRAWP